MTRRSREPRAIGAELADVLRARGWDGRLAAARVVARWPEVVGDAVAAHCQPSRLEEDGTLQVVADSAASRSAPTRAVPADMSRAWECGRIGAGTGSAQGPDRDRERERDWERDREQDPSHDDAHGRR